MCTTFSIPFNMHILPHTQAKRRVETRSEVISKDVAHHLICGFSSSDKTASTQVSTCASLDTVTTGIRVSRNYVLAWRESLWDHAGYLYGL